MKRDEGGPADRVPPADVWLVCGGRDYRDKECVWEALDFTCERLGRRPNLLIHGGAAGADEWAALWAAHRAVPARAFWAEWKRYGGAAGPLRNQRMLDEGKPRLVLAFPGGKGTADMVRRARKTGVPVISFKRRRERAEGAP